MCLLLSSRPQAREGGQPGNTCVQALAALSVERAPEGSAEWGRGQGTFVSPSAPRLPLSGVLGISSDLLWGACLALREGNPTGCPVAGPDGAGWHGNPKILRVLRPEPNPHGPRLAPTPVPHCPSCVARPDAPGGPAPAPEENLS